MFLDEPTNHLDIYMRESLTRALSEYTGTLLLVTHDRYLMQTLACPILYLENGKATFYENFEKMQTHGAEADNVLSVREPEKPQRQAYGKEQRKRRAEVRTRLKKVETEIEELGAHIVELENEINDPEVLRDHLLLRDKCDELDDTRFHQQELFDEWEKLAEEQEQYEAEDALT
ncbi:MAG: ABC transporter ATP-binding protein, partial [Gemmiger sp.]